MAEEKVFHPTEIVDNPFPDEAEGMGTDSSQPAGSEKTYTTEKIQNTEFPKKRTAVELLSVTFNTRTKKILAEYQFTESGALQIGKYELGVSGDLRISPDGIVARDSAGNVTFALDGTDGSAVFKGEIRAGSLVSGQVIVGNNSVIIDGENKQIIVNDGTNDRILIGYDPGGF